MDTGVTTTLVFDLVTTWQVINELDDLEVVHMTDHALHDGTGAPTLGPQHVPLALTIVVGQESPQTGDPAGEVLPSPTADFSISLFFSHIHTDWFPDSLHTIH